MNTSIIAIICITIIICTCNICDAYVKINRDKKLFNNKKEETDKDE